MNTGSFKYTAGDDAVWVQKYEDISPVIRGLCLEFKDFFNSKIIRVFHYRIEVFDKDWTHLFNVRHSEFSEPGGSLTVCRNLNENFYSHFASLSDPACFDKFGEFIKEFR